jgi:O-antigen/teichoic acid export membrane protein
MLKKLFKKITMSPTIMSWTYNTSIFVHGLVVTPLLLYKFDDTELSLWYLLQTLLSFGLLADAGFGHTLQRAVAFLHRGAKKIPKDAREYKESDVKPGPPNYPMLANLLSTSTIIYLTLTILMVLILSVAGMATLWNLLNIAGHPTIFYLAFLIMVINSLISLQSIKWASFMRGLRFVALLNRFKTIMATIRIIAFFSILVSNLGILGLMVFLFAELTFTFFYMKSFIKGWFRNNNITLKSQFFFDKEIFRSLWRVSWKSGLNTFGYFFAKYGTSLVIAQINNTTQMANFLFTQRILGFINRIGEAPVFANAPVYYGMMAVKKYKELKKDASKSIFLSFFILIGGLVAFGLTGNYLLELLNIDNRIVDANIYIILSVIMILDLHARIHGLFYISTNSVPFLIPSLITGASMIVLGYYVSGPYGILGVVLVQLIVNAMCNFWFSAYLSLKLIKWPFLNYLYDITINGTKIWYKRILDFQYFSKSSH